jgi:Flp pilus assembly pilin Flp
MVDTNKQSSVDLMTNFITDETGAVTIEWTVLVAALVGLGFAVLSVVSGGTEDIAQELGQSFADHDAEFTHF